MSFTVALDSTQRENTTEPTHNFTTTFNPPIQTYNKEGYMWAVGLVKANLWYSFFNIIDSQYNNAQFRWVDELAVVHDFTIPDGVYNIYQLSTVIQENITAQGGTGSNISIVPNFPELKIQLVITPGSFYEVDLSVSDFYKLLGFTDTQALSGNITSTTQGDLVGDITNGIDNLYINCDIVAGSWYNSDSSSVLHSFVPNSPPGSNLDIVPIKIIYLPVKEQTDYLRSIRMYITDNQGRFVNLNGEDTQYLLHFKLIEI